MTSKQGYTPDFAKYVGKKVLVKLQDERQIGGKIAHVDHFMNMVLDDAFEYLGKEGVQRPLYKTIIRGSTIVYWEFLEKERS